MKPKSLGYLGFILIVFVCAILLQGCTKAKKNTKLLPGSWAVNVVRIEDGAGFLFYDSLAAGSFKFTAEQLSGKSNYSYAYFGQNMVTDSAVFENNNIWLDSKGEELSIARPTDTLRAKIIMLTNKSLTFEFYDEIAFRLKRFTCTRQ
ncbi:MAG: hypothetical protein RLZZ357_1992 [Bacteroidota bacterium]|jgi:hypothetical protein